MAAIEDASNQKRNAACEECRVKKAKCSGDQPTCQRCLTKNIDCVYAFQKPMGRPKKRRVDEAYPCDLERPDATTNSSAELPTAAAVNDSGFGISSSDYAPNDQENDGRWFQGGGFGSPMMPDLGNQAWAISADSVSHTPSLTYDNSTHGTSTIAGASISPPNGFIDPSIAQARSQANGTLSTTTMPTPGCACLSTMYLSLSTLQSMADFSFPHSLYTLREAIFTAWTVLHCETCPKQFITALHNVQLLGMFLLTIAERYERVLDCIEAEQLRATASNETKVFRMSDLNGAKVHLHSSDPAMDMSDLSINLDPLEWRKLTKRVVKTEIEGSDICCPTFMDLVEDLVNRQTRWHSMPKPEGFPRSVLKWQETQTEEQKQDAICLRFANDAKLIVGNLNFE